MNKVIIIVFSILLFIGCTDDVKVGYLETDNAEYTPDYLIVRKTPNPVLDEIRIENNAPWVSDGIQGVEGTLQIFYEIANVRSSDGDAQKMLDELIIRGGGVFNLPLENDVPVGHYLISIRIYNEGYSFIKNDVFTIIVE